MNLRVEGSGIKIEAVQHHVASKPFPDQIPGEHLWVITGAWRVDVRDVVAVNRFHLDTENLLNLAGPGCLWCERQYSFELAKQRCRGGPDPQRSP